VDLEMTDKEADRIVDVYSRRGNRERYSSFSRGHLFMLQQVEAAMLASLSDCGVKSLSDKRVLEIGCGTGFWIRQFIQWGAEPRSIAGVDLIKERLNEARLRTPPEVIFALQSAAHLGFESASIDIVLQATVMTSILDEEVQQSVANELLRVLRPGGVILWYDFRYDNPRNRDVRGISARRIRELFRGTRVQIRSTVLLPPIARALAPHSRLACDLLSLVPPLRSHYVASIQVR
jgi:ubiquinone/menaquinone biosynthesis C-methylase UbiE